MCTGEGAARRFLRNLIALFGSEGVEEKVWELETYGALFDRTKDGKIVADDQLSGGATVSSFGGTLGGAS